MTTVMSVSFAGAIAFQLPLLIRLLASMGIVSSEGMRQYRRVAVVALLVFAAIITPPDVVSQVLIFIPCYALYEYGIGIAANIEARRAKEEAEYQAKMEAEKARKTQEQAEKEAVEAEAEAKQTEEVVETPESEQAEEPAEDIAVEDYEARELRKGYEQAADPAGTENPDREIKYEVVKDDNTEPYNDVVSELDREPQDDDHKA